MPDTNSLQSQLNSVFQESPYVGKRSFLPSDDLKRIITVPSVTQYCSTYAAATLKDETSKIIAYVFGSEGDEGKYSGDARQVFAILVLIDRPSLIPGVVAENIRDHDLPLAQCSKRGTEFQLSKRSKSLRPLECLRKWGMSDRRAFDDIQYEVNVPVFRLFEQNNTFFPPGQFVAKKLDNRSVLPFTYCDTKKQIVSGSSRVVRVQIHPAHHDFNKQVSRSMHPSSELPQL